MNECIAFLNVAGKGFVNIAWPMLIQSSLLIVAVLVLDRLLRRRVKAVVRYGIWLLVLVKLVLPPSLAAPTSLVYWIGAQLPSLPSQIETVTPEPPAASPVFTMTERPVVRPEPRFTQREANPAPAFDPPGETSTIAPEPVVAPAVLAPPPTPAPPITWQAMVFLAWLLVVVVMTLLLIQRAFFVRGLVAQSTEAPEALADLLDRCRQQMGVSKTVGLRLTSLSTSPSVCGLWKPRILMPQGMITRLDTQQSKSILLHELAHVKRGDLWVNLVQALLQIAYFFHPLLWLANLMIRRVREQAVDETVLAAMGSEAEDYPRTLLNISKLAFGRPTFSLRLIGVVESKKALTARIKHIVSRPFPKSAKLGLAGLVLVATVAAVLLPMAEAKTENREPAEEIKDHQEDFGAFVLENRPSGQTDRLYLIDRAGDVRSIFAGLDLCETIGGAHMMAIDEDRKALWIAENAGDRLWKFDLETGDVSGRFKGNQASAVTVDPESGNVWVIAEPETIRVVSPQGHHLATYEIPGFDIAYSPHDKSFWVVGKEIYKVDAQGSVLARIGGVNYRAVSVATDAHTGAAWVAVASHSQLPQSRNELWHIDANGALKRKIDLDELRPYCVRVDSDDEVVWVGCSGTVLRYGTDGRKLKSARGGSAFSVALSPHENTAYLTDRAGTHKKTVLDSGLVKSQGLLKTVEDLESSQKWIVRVPFANAKLRASQAVADMIPTSREASAHRLERVGAVLLAHATDHDGAFPAWPSALRQIRTQLDRSDFPWCVKHLEYRGKGKRVSSDKTTAVAYDKTLLKNDQGTNVLFSDGHVAFVEVAQLAALKIRVPTATDESAECLMQLGMALLIHANDHGDQLPQTLDEVREEMREIDFRWCAEHVEYVGQGKKPSKTSRENRTIVIAYDRTLLTLGEGTNVLFLDPHVEFMAAARLGGIGIETAPLRDKPTVQEEVITAMVLPEHNGLSLTDEGESEPTRTIQGIVTDTLGRPRECVYVAPQGTNVWKGVMSDAQGRFVLENVTRDQKVWLAWSQASALYGIFRMPPTMPSEPLRIRLDLDVADLSGRMVGADGKALTDREVELIVTTADGTRLPWHHRPKTDAFGYYASEAPCGPGVTIEARVPDADADTASFSTEPVKVRAGQGFIEMPVLVAAEKKIQPDFDENSHNDGMLHCRGRVVDESGKPIAGVRVHMSFDMPGWMSTWVRDAMTDSQGRWHRAVPPQCMDLSLEFQHSQFYIEDDRAKPSREELEKGTHRVAMKRGLVLAGRVVNEQGRPVDNVLVCAGRYYSRTPSSTSQIIEDSTTARTRRDGTFRVSGLPSGTRTIVAYSSRYAPTRQEVDIQTTTPDIEVVLAQGKTYRGRIVDARGLPVEGVSVAVNDWRLGKERRSMNRLARTDAQGNFALTNLPEGQIALYFGKKPLMGFSKDLPEDLSQVDEMVMYDVPVFTGRVVDAETDEPVPEFHIANGIKWKRTDASFDWSRYHRGGTKDANGAFTHRWRGYGISYPVSSVAAIKIQAPGYLPAIAPPLELGEECQPLTIRLRRGTPITGTVRAPDSSAAAEAQIALVRPGEKAFIDRDQFSEAGFVGQVENVKKTDAHGAFELPPTEEQGLIVAVHKSGYAQILSEAFANGSDLTLTAWSRVEGATLTWKEGEGPTLPRLQSGDLEIAVYPLDRNTSRNVPSITWLFDRISPTGDTFTLEYLPAVPLVVGRITRYEMNDGTYLIPQPGKTSPVIISSGGRAVTGRIDCPPGFLKSKSIALTDPRQTHAVAFRMGEDTAMPSNVTTFDENSFKWLWRDKEHVYAPSQKVRKRFVPRIDEDGQFTFAGLSPGEYEFVINIHAPLGENVSCGRGVFAGVAIAQFTVPQGRSDSPLRVPDIQVRLLTYPGAGERAPLFVEQTFGGRTFRLEDLRGKVVLLDFWASWCSPCVAELPKMRALHEAFADREDFAMIGLSLDWDLERARRMIDEKQLDWTQLTLGSMDESIMVKQYGVGEIPMTILIDADGTILARGADAKELKPMIEKALGKRR